MTGNCAGRAEQGQGAGEEAKAEMLQESLTVKAEKSGGYVSLDKWE